MAWVSLLLLLAPASGLGPAQAKARLLQVLREEGCSPSSFSLSRSAGKRVTDAVRDLEAAATDDEKPSFPRDLVRIDGTWSLQFSNNAPPPPPDFLRGLVGSGSLSGSDVFQTIDVFKRRVVNAVTIAPWPQGSFLGDALLSAPLIGDSLASLSEATVRIELDHEFTVDGDGSTGGPRRAAGTNRVAINLVQVRRTLDGLDSLKAPAIFDALLPRESSYDVPEPVRVVGGLISATALGGGLFDTTYADDEIRISRGSAPLNPELRVFFKEAPVVAEYPAPDFTTPDLPEDSRATFGVSAAVVDPDDYIPSD